MKFKEGDRVVIVKGSEDHGIPEGTLCLVVDAEDSFEHPYELVNMFTDKTYDNNVTEDEIEFVED